MSHKRHDALLHIRMPSELKATALQVAQAERRPLANLLRLVIEDGLRVRSTAGHRHHQRPRCKP